MYKSNVERIKKDIESLARFNATPGNGLTRFTYSKEDRKARDYIKREMANMGLKVYEDAVGTIVGRLEGRQNKAPAVMIGSHFDSVKNGGNFDGPAGVVTGLEIARVLKEKNLTVEHPIEFIAMIEEEGGRFGSGLIASRAMTGNLTRDDLDNYVDSDGISMAEAMRDFGFDPDRFQESVREPESLKAFFELHIEQGPVLEQSGNEIGLVEKIVGIHQLEVTVNGRPDHAGTTPMNMRKDAMDMASKVISKISHFADNADNGTVATVGNLNVHPGAMNIIPGKVTFTVDIRSPKEQCVQRVYADIDQELTDISESMGMNFSIEEKMRVSPLRFSEKILEKMKYHTKKLGYSHKIMSSGAGHDAMMMAQITDVGLLFVPSKNGRSHCPEEWTDYEDLAKGVDVLLNTIIETAGVVQV